MITMERLHEVLIYDSGTGVFTWKVRLSNNVPIGSQAGRKMGNGYIRIGIDGKEYLAHRLAWLYVYGCLPDHEIDHRDRTRNHNWISNLREATHQCNSRNSSKRKDNKSGVTGVTWYGLIMKWTATITIDRRTINIGAYIIFSEAVKARWQAEKKYGWPNCCTTSSSYMWLKANGMIDED